MPLPEPSMLVTREHLRAAVERPRPVLVGLALGFVLAVGFYAYVFWGTSDLACPHPSSGSNFGRRSWSLLPPGPFCTWTVEANGIADVQGPGAGFTVWLLLAIGLSWLWVIQVGRARRLRRSMQPIA